MGNSCNENSLNSKNFSKQPLHMSLFAGDDMTDALTEEADSNGSACETSIGRENTLLVIPAGSASVA